MRGNAFRAARALDLVAETLPKVGRLDARPALRSSAPLSRPAVEQVAAARQQAARVSPARPEPAQLYMRRELPQACKARPASFKGNGSGRNFVPWCRKS